jgi:hypothetical protein
MNTDQAYVEAGFTKLEVDIHSLTDFADALQREIDTNLAKAYHQITQGLNTGPQFAFSSELDLDGKRDTYDTYLTKAKQLFKDIVDGTQQLADAARQIGANYAASDQFAKVTTSDVTKVLPKLPPPPVYVPPSGGRIKAV